MASRGELQMSDTLSFDPVTVTIPVALRLSGLGRTKLYELLASQEIESVRVGTRRLIVFASFKARLTDPRSNTSSTAGRCRD
jgi:excisionase family DNA binding protein